MRAARRSQHIFRRIEATGDDQHRRLQLDHALDGRAPRGRRQPVQKRQFLGADDLDLVRVDQIQIADQRRAPLATFRDLDLAIAAFRCSRPVQVQARVDFFEQFVSRQ